MTERWTIRTLWGWRKGEDTPELMEAWDDYTVDANLNGWTEACERAIRSWGDDLYVHRYIDLLVEADQVRSAFETPEILAERCRFARRRAHGEAKA